MKTGADVYAHILRRVGEDPEFRNRLIADPKGVIEGETGLQLPDEGMVIIQEVIAAAQQTPSADGPLTEDELIQVMGGNPNPLPTLCDNPQPWMNCD